jgi:hypothetical protein
MPSAVADEDGAASCAAGGNTEGRKREGTEKKEDGLKFAPTAMI